MPAMSAMVGRTILEQADVLAGFSEDVGQLTRTYLTEQHRRAGEYVMGLMREAGMEAGFDVLGNVVGRYPALDSAAPTVMTGSHMDSVRNAGRYDGLFGILSPIACVAELNRQGRRLPYHLEVVAFGDEEGVRFGVTLIGSKAMGGIFDPAWLSKTDDAGISLEEALRSFGGDPHAWASVDRRGRIAAFVESHIEQGPVLLNEGLSLGVVTAIAGATRARVKVKGLAGHAGTVPMNARQDALAAAAEMVLAVEQCCAAGADLVGTVGRMAVLPGAVNVIPQDVEFTVDVRSGNDAARRQAIHDLRGMFDTIASRRNVAVNSEVFFEADAAPCDARIQDVMAQAITASGLPERRLPSGAGHDAMSFPAVCPMGMLFVRCGNNGISHHPDEIMTAADAQCATEVLLDVFGRLGPLVQLPR